MRAIFIALLLGGTLLACDKRNSAELKTTPTVGGEFAFDDQFGTPPSPNTLLRIDSRITSTSHDGSEADLVLTYTLDPYVRDAILPDSYIQFDYVAPDQPDQLLARAPITEELTGTVELTVPTTDEEARLIASINGLEPGVVDDQGILVAQVPGILQRETTDLNRVREIKAELVEDSYESSVVGGRRVHKFAVKVTDPTAGPIDDLIGESGLDEDFEYSVSGLEYDASAHFVALENDTEDKESPVSVTFTEYPLSVYLVIDVSKSIVDSRQAHNLTDAVSSTVVALTRNAQFNYRTFTGNVSRIEGLRQLEFDTADASATAIYHALDTALSDIEDFGSINQDKVVMVFTDGKDRASRNHYNAFIDNEQVHEYIVQRVEQIRSTQADVLGRQLDVYTIGFYDESTGIDMSTEITKLDAISKAGGTTKSYNNLNATDINDAFAAVVQNVRGVYYLQYSSQQTPDNNKIELVVKVNGHESRILLPTQYQAP